MGTPIITPKCSIACSSIELAGFRNRKTLNREFCQPGIDADPSLLIMLPSKNSVSRRHNNILMIRDNAPDGIIGKIPAEGRPGLSTIGTPKNAPILCA
jgi:hypothetical protein